MKNANDYFDCFEVPYYNNGKPGYFACRKGSSFHDYPEEVSYEMYHEIWERHMLKSMTEIIEAERRVVS